MIDPKKCFARCVLPACLSALRGAVQALLFFFRGHECGKALNYKGNTTGRSRESVARAGGAEIGENSGVPCRTGRSERPAAHPSRVAHDLAARDRPTTKKQQASMMKQGLMPIFAAALLAAAVPRAPPSRPARPSSPHSTRIADARESHTEERVARLRAVRERVRHFCAHEQGDVSASDAQATPTQPTSTPARPAPRPAAGQPV
jgi:hypothetical protein